MAKERLPLADRFSNLCSIFCAAWISLGLALPASKSIAAPLLADRPMVVPPVGHTADATPPVAPGSAAPTADMTSPSVQLDPLDSPHPIPWNWVLANLTEASALLSPQTRYYRSQALISPDGQYAAYSRIQMQLKPDWMHSQVSSVLFLENLKTRDLRAITASSPLAAIPTAPENPEDSLGAIAVLIPVSWSKSGDRLLAREFESLFGSDIASDYAVIWDRELNRTSTVAPTQVSYSNAILLGWSQTDPKQVLFKAGNLGDAQWPLWQVDLSGQTQAAPEDHPQVFGQTKNTVWTGPQAHL